MTRFDVDGLGAYIREQREKAQLSLRQLARIAGVSNPYLSQVERGLRRPSAEILQQIAHALRISAEALYVQAGLLEAPSADRAVVEAIQSDSALSDRHKQVLLDIYRSFRAESELRAGEPAAPAPPEPAPIPEPAPGSPSRDPQGARADHPAAELGREPELVTLTKEF